MGDEVYPPGMFMLIMLLILFWLLMWLWDVLMTILLDDANSWRFITSWIRELISPDTSD
jgi:hypothetical protein